RLEFDHVGFAACEQNRATGSVAPSGGRTPAADDRAGGCVDEGTAAALLCDEARGALRRFSGPGGTSGVCDRTGRRHRLADLPASEDLATSGDDLDVQRSRGTGGTEGDRLHPA